MKMFRFLAAAVFAFGLLAAVRAADATMTEMKMQTNCPIKGGPIDKDQFVDYQGKRIYFCCGGCDAKFKKDPAAYLKQMKDAGIMLADAPAATPAAPAGTVTGKPQTMCCVSGEEIDKKQFEDYNGKRIYFCCNHCQAKFDKDPAAYVKKMQDQGIVLEDAPKAAAPTK